MFSGIIPFYKPKKINFVDNMVMVYNIWMFYIALADVGVKPMTFTLLARRSNQLS